MLGLGGFGSGAAVYEGAKLGLRTAFLQPDYVPGKANQWLSKYAGKIFVQWAGTGSGSTNATNDTATYLVRYYQGGRELYGNSVECDANENADENRDLYGHFYAVCGRTAGAAQRSDGGVVKPDRAGA